MVIRKLEENKIDVLKTAICRDFYLACKNKKDVKIGLELERLPVYAKTHKTVDYFGSNGLYRLLRQIAYNDEWRYITDLTFINGLQKGKDTITLEPGGQTEYSLSPSDNIYNLKTNIENLDKKVKSVCDFLGISLLEYPITPLTDGHDVEIIPKRRYQTMAKYMTGKKCFSMMRESAGIQVAVDYTDEVDFMRKYKISMLLVPFATAIFANSPIRCGKNTGYKSYRASVWLDTDENRCGFVTEKIFNHLENFTFNDYIDAVFKVPLLFVSRDNSIFEIGGSINFEEYFNNGYENLCPQREDYDLHSSLFFPEVRLKNIIEIRNHDTQQGDMKYAIPAFYKGLLYEDNNLQNVFDLLKRLTYQDYLQLRDDVPKYALNSKIGKNAVKEYARVLLDMSYLGLKKLGKDEEKLLAPIMELVYDGLCPADVILDKWNSTYARDIHKLVEDVKVK